MKRAIKQKISSPPEFLKPILWSYRFSELNLNKHKTTITTSIINHGGWRHWRWMANYYGKGQIRKLVECMPVTAFRPGALRLLSLLLGIKKFNYAPRGIKPKYKSGVPETRWF